MNFETIITNISGTWEDVKNACRTTVSKGDSDIPATTDFKKQLLISEHSPIREIVIKFKWNEIYSWVATHWVRHKWESYVSSRRTDRHGIKREELLQNELVDFRGNMNVQNLIDTMRKRLCFQASKETRMLAESLKKELHKFEPEIADVAVPNCIYRCGCPESFNNNCNFFENFILHAYTSGIDITNIQQRYDFYNQYFYSK